MPIQIQLNETLTVQEIMRGGIDVIKSGQGLPLRDSTGRVFSRGDFIVHVNIDWETVNGETWVQLLKVSPN